jgi:hypothetical protein
VTASDAPISYAEISGKVVANGRGVSRATVRLVGPDGKIFVTLTNLVGGFRFESLPTGKLYTINVIAKRYTFAQQNIQLDGPVTGLSISALP